MATSPAASSATAAAVVAGGSTATTITETIAGSYVFRIDGFSGTKDLGVGKSIKSSTFRVGGHAWYIDCYPCGELEEDNAGWVTLFLYLDHPGPNDKVEAECSFTVMGSTGDPFQETTDKHVFKSGDTSAGLFIERKELESLLRDDDCFQLRCVVCIFKEFPAVPPPDLHRHLGDLLASRVGGDVTFEVGGELFTAHRYILAARSSVFTAELFDPSKEAATAARIRIDDMEPKVFRALLHFIYADSVNVVEDDDDKVMLHQHLLVAADRYNLERLKLICEEMLCNCIDASMAATTLLLASKHGCQRLKKACSTFLTDLLASVQEPDQQSCHRAPLTGKRQRS